MRTVELSLGFQPRIVERARLSWDALRLVILTSANAGGVSFGLFMRLVCQVRRTLRVDRNMNYAQARSFTPQNVLSLAKRVLSLDEPWRSRFLTVIAGQEPVSGWPDGLPRRFPSPVEVALWLGDPGAYRRIGTMVHTWTHHAV